MKLISQAAQWSRTDAQWKRQTGREGEEVKKGMMEGGITDTRQLQNTI